jgi:hypothetical protein
MAARLRRQAWCRAPRLLPHDQPHPRGGGSRTGGLAGAGVSAPAHPLRPAHQSRQAVEGHLWQGRFFSSALDDSYLWAAIRYVERNPVRARLVRRAENYRWSSAAAHCGIGPDSVLTKDPGWSREFKSVGDWSAWLAEGDRPEQLEVLRRHVERGLPCGAEGFIRKLERQAKQVLRLRPRGRPKKAPP